MNKLLTLIVVITLVGCSLPFELPVRSFEGYIVSKDSDAFLVECSDAVNRNVIGNVDPIGQDCTVKISDETIFFDESGTEIAKTDLKVHQKVEIELVEKKNINKTETSRVVTAEKITIIN